MVFKQHFKLLINQYGFITCVNLIDSKGYEGVLGVGFRNYIEIMNDDSVRYVHFDFHKECKKMRFDRLYILLDELDLKDSHLTTSLNYQKEGSNSENRYRIEGGFDKEINHEEEEQYSVYENDVLIKKQTSTVRTNCVDCYYNLI